MRSRLKVSIQGHGKAWRILLPNALSLIRRAVEKIEMAEAAECVIQLSDDASVQRLNAQFRGQNKPTNVLSFSSDEPGYLGDIIFARETIEREAMEQGKNLPDHLTHLVVHGVLHLMGHDHLDEAEAEEMEAIEIMVLKSLGIANPYLVA